MANSLSVTERTKHIDIRHHFIRQLIQNGTITVVYCKTSDMIADMLTKALSKELFLFHRDQGICMTAIQAPEAHACIAMTAIRDYLAISSAPGQSSP